jgi:hypothetical protein
MGILVFAMHACWRHRGPRTLLVCGFVSSGGPIQATDSGLFICLTLTIKITFLTRFVSACSSKSTWRSAARICIHTVPSLSCSRTAVSSILRRHCRGSRAVILMFYCSCLNALSASASPQNPSVLNPHLFDKYAAYRFSHVF